MLSESLSYFPNGKTASLFERVQSGSNALTHTVRFGSKVAGLKPFIVFPNQLILSKFIIDTPGENITEAAKYLANLVVSNGYHEDIKLGHYDDMMEWIARHPKDKMKLGELLAFADTGVKDFELEKRHSDKSYEVRSLHRRYNNGQRVGKTDLPFTEESFGTRALFLLGCYILQSLESGSPLLVDEIDSIICSRWHVKVKTADIANTQSVLSVREKRLNLSFLHLYVTGCSMKMMEEMSRPSLNRIYRWKMRQCLIEVYTRIKKKKN